MYKKTARKSGLGMNYAPKLWCTLKMAIPTLIICSCLLPTAKVFAQRITYVQKQVNLAQIFKVIKKQTRYNVVWFEHNLDTKTTFDANFKDATITEVLDRTLLNQPASYEINGKTIVIKPGKAKNNGNLNKAISSSSETSIDVTGRVLDENDQPLTGAIVKVKAGSKAIATNANGEFELKAVAENAMLLLSYLGYETREIKAIPNLGTLVLSPSTGKLKEIEINAGYYTVKEKQRTGAISRITAQQIERQPVNNPLLTLQGTMPGVQVSQNSGVPGAGISVQIRGQNSIARGNLPLYIVDGVIYPTDIKGAGSIGAIFSNGVSAMSMINPSDIESIEILKDADATAIYGSRGANGVVLISTKKNREQKTSINAAVSQGISQVGHKIDLLNTEQYVAMRKEAFKNDGLTPGTTAYDINGTWDQTRNTDWQKELIGGTAPVTSASANVMGGTAKSNYLISGNYYKEGTVYPGDFSFDRFSLRSVINLGSAADRFQASLTTNYSRTNNNMLSSDLTSFILLAPNLPELYDQYGKLNWSNNTMTLNPMSYLLRTYNGINNNLLGNLTLSYRIAKNLNLKTSIGYTTIKGNEVQKTPLASIAPSSSSYTSAGRISYFANSNNDNFIAEPILSYTTKLGPGTFDGLLGASIQQNNTKNTGLRASNFSSDDLMNNIASAGTITTDRNIISQYRYFATYARLNYNLSEKYFLNLTGRRDGSSRFGSGKQFANFWAVGSAWNFSEEKFIKDQLPLISFGKLRASYGTTGNDQIGDYGYLQLWGSGTTYQGNPTLSPINGAPNADFAWETTRKLEAALQLGILKDRINLEVSWYRNRSSNQLLNRILPISTGLVSMIANLPATVENKGWEFDLSAKLLHTGALKWTSSLNFTKPKNTLLAYPGLETSADASFYQIGQPLSIIKTLKVSVDTQTGLYVIADKNGSGTIDDADRYQIKFLGKQWYGGFQNSVSYKKFNLDFLFSFVKQNARGYRAATAQAPGLGLPTTPTANQFSQVLGRWQQAGDQSLTQKFSTTSTNVNSNTYVQLYGDVTFTDASYIRLRNVSLTWAFPQSVLSALKISNAGLSLQGQNLFTLTKYIGLDPETPQGLNLPPLRTIALGLNVTF